MPERNVPLADRSNEEWLSALRNPGPERDAALEDLRALLVRGLGYALASYGNVKEADVEDFSQDALLKILAALDSFRGESRFTTWANKIAVHVAFTELRRRRWRNISLDQVTASTGDELIPRTWVDPEADTEQQAIQREVLDTMRDVIANGLTDKQQQALVAVRIHGMPIAHVAEQMGTNPNALYKLLHDARERLKREIMDRNLSPQEILAAFA
jgi:RNA polymerase sigma-70 factor (ECF subfamily)